MSDAGDHFKGATTTEAVALAIAAMLAAVSPFVAVFDGPAAATPLVAAALLMVRQLLERESPGI
jgi:hypothetical protein